MAVFFQKFVQGFFYLGPLIFAAGLLWPLFSQVMTKVDWAPFGMTPIVAGFFLAAVPGIVAQVRGRWL